MTQVAEIETIIPQSKNIVNSTNAYQHNTNINLPKSSVPKNNIKTNKKPINTIRQTKISDMLVPSSSTSTVTSNSMDKPIKCQNEQSIESNNITVKQSSEKRLASPVHTETKRSSVEQYITEIPEDIWESMDVDVTNPSVKVLKSASVVKNSKIQVKQNEWICSGIVVDETGQKEVEFSSEVNYLYKYINLMLMYIFV